MEDGGPDCFIPGRYLKDALPGDTVRIREGAPDERGPQGAVIAVEEEGPRLYVGRLLPKEEGRCSVAPDAAIRYPVRVRKSTLGDARPGDKVRFSVQWKEGELTASIVTIYGSADSAKVCADAIVDSMGIPSVFPEDVLSVAQSLEKAGVSAQELQGREDFRDALVFTIDGRDAKDLDDAVSLEPGPEGGWVLGDPYRRRLPFMLKPRTGWTGRRGCGARRCISPTGSSPCCRRHYPTGYALSIRTRTS